MATYAENVLEKVKINIGITGEFHDNKIKGHIDFVRFLMEDAGVHDTVLQSENGISVLSRGVDDIWNYGQNNGDLSPLFYKRLIQLIYPSGKATEQAVE